VAARIYSPQEVRFVATYRFRCPSCGKTLKVDDAMLEDIRRRGKGGHCPRCKEPVSVEGMGSSDGDADRQPGRWRRSDGEDGPAEA
jgi:hypothetical protein